MDNLYTVYFESYNYIVVSLTIKKGDSLEMFELLQILNTIDAFQNLRKFNCKLFVLSQETYTILE